MKKIYLTGLFASVVYTFAVILGGLLYPGYSHLKQPISELSMLGAPNLALMVVLFTLYNILLLVFSTIVFRWGQSKLTKTSAALLFLVGLSGVMMNIFTQDPINTTLTFRGLMHFIFAGAAALGTILAIFFGGFGFAKVFEGKGFKLMSIIFGTMVIVFGGMTPLTVNNFPDYFGVVERVTIFSFVIWLGIFSYKIYKVESDQ